VTKKYNLYIGRAGQLAVMAEFLLRGWNVAMPEVDIGDDIFVVEDENGVMKRVQVKTSSLKSRNNTFSAQFQIPIKQLQKVSRVPIYYIFIARRNDGWTIPLIIQQEELLDHFKNFGIDDESKRYINLYFSYSKDKVVCSGQDFTKYIGDYSDFPIIEH